MRPIFSKILLVCTLILLFTKCTSPSTSNPSYVTDTTTKYQQTDPFKKTITESEYFEIDSKQDQVVEGKRGTIIVCPKGCFQNAKGEIVEGIIKVELAESLSLEEMIPSNLTTTSNGKLLETDGMIYVNATLHGEKLVINKQKPIHIEIPTKNKKQGMSAYKGIRDANGNMNWVEPKPIDNYLVPIDMQLLNFLPDGFQTEVQKGMPYRNYNTATKALTDSLYFMLSVTDGSELIKGFVDTDVNEPYYNKRKQIIKGKYTKQSYQRNANKDTLNKVNDTAVTSKANCGIDPAIIKTIKAAKYQNTFIATKEFEERLRIIFKTCNNAVLEIYVKNIDKNLFVADSLAEELVKETTYTHRFHEFYLQKKMNVKNADRYTKLLQGYYEKQLSKIRFSLEQAKQEVIKQLNKKNKEAENVVNSYRKLLWSREQYRMETYGFNWSDTGWVNVDRGTLPKEWGPERFEITIQNSNQFDRIYTYAVYTSIKSIYRLNTDNNAVFYVGDNNDKEMLMPKQQLAYAIVVAYKNETSFLAIKQFETGTDKTLSLLPTPATQQLIKEQLKAYNRQFEKENMISEDLMYMDTFFIEQNRQKGLMKESEFIKKLWHIAYPCCQATTYSDVEANK